MIDSDTGGYEEAIGCYNKAIELEPDYFQAWNNKGLAFLERDKREYEYKYKRAIECFDTAIKYFEKAKINPKEYIYYRLSEDRADTYNNLDVCYYELRDYDKAIECFEKADEINKHDKLAETNRTVTRGKIKE